MFLVLGIVAACSIGYSQTIVTTTGQNGPVTTGTVNSNVDANLADGGILTYNSLVTFTVAPGQVYTFQVVNTPSANGPLSLISDIANAISNSFNNPPYVRGVNSSGTIVPFGSDAGQVALQFISGPQQNVPFDFGLSAVLGAGAIAAAKTARRKKAQESVA